MNTKSTKSGIAGGIFLIGLGVVIVTGSWWPGMLLVIGLAVTAERVFHKEYMQALLGLAICSAIAVISISNIPWRIYGPFILISLGIVTLAQGVLSKQE
ncbi:MAG: hypothetical protein OZ914_09270 [Anaerolineaceae bacterium]|jgi:hypothetical protein|nr:hypothetical protein [Anaerolineaceae bacterium]OQY89482.1 MAG: hypothetical protein B6D38_06160 [Anaerolineae bacterium UTCFX1]